MHARCNFSKCTRVTYFPCFIPFFNIFFSPSSKPNCTAYEYVNWSSPMANRDWSSRNSALQPLMLHDSAISRNPVASVASSVYSKEQQRNTAFIRSPNNRTSLFQTPTTVEVNTKYHSYPDMKQAPSAISAGKKAFNSAMKEREPFELQPLQFYETETQGSAGLYTPFLCIQEGNTIKNDTRVADCFVMTNNNNSSTYTNARENVPPKTQLLFQKATPSSSQNLPPQTAAHNRRYTKPNISCMAMESTAVEHFSPMKFLTVSEDVVAEREISLSPSNILNDEQNV